MNQLSRHAAFVVFLLIYAAALALQIDHGLASGDGHGAVQSIQSLLDNGKIEISRPPGHPTTELYLFGGFGWVLLKIFGVEFGDKSYLIGQALAALITLAVFYELLLRIETGRARALLATICLACSAQFLFNALDGEEFNFGLLFLLISVRLLIPAATLPRLMTSILAFALATGSRPELVFAAIVFPFYCFLDSKFGWKCALASVAFAAITIAIVWLPILLTGIRAPYTAGMGFRESILGGIYRILFQALTPIVFLFLATTLVGSLRLFRKELSAKNFVFTVSCIAPVVFLLVFFFHPSKAAHLLVAIPFLLVLAASRSLLLLLALSFFSVLSCFLGVDIFKDRQFAGPHFVSGSYSQAIRQKPYYKLDYIRKLSAQCEDRPAAIIGDAWPWDFDYQVERNTFVAREQDLHGEIKHDVPAFFTRGDHCIFLSPEAAFESKLLKELHLKGYTLKVDVKVYRTFFARYDVRSGIASGTIDVDGVPLTLFRVD